MATTKRVQVDIDVNSQKVKIAGEETLKLSKQIQILTTELSFVEKGSAQWDLLTTKLNSVKDAAAETKTKSGELFGTLGQLGGGIGEFGNQADNAFGKLKLFSTFSFKDVSGQVKGFGKDIGEVVGNVSKATGVTGAYTKITEGLGKAFKVSGESSKFAQTAVKGFGAALTATGIGLIATALGYLINNFTKIKDAILKAIPGLQGFADAVGGVIDFVTDLIGVTSQAEREEAKRQATYAKAKANTEIVNKGIQREINLLKAKGATEEEVDKKQKQMLLNRKKDLEAAANAQRTLYGDQGQEYLDIKNELAVIDATATKRQQDATQAATDKANAKADQNRQKQLQKDKEYRQAQADAAVNLAKNAADTDEAVLRAALKKQQDIKNEGKTISKEQAKDQADEINRIVTDELKKDKETRQKDAQEKIDAQKAADKTELDNLSVKYEEIKLKNGEFSKQATEAQDNLFAKQKQNLETEKAALIAQQQTKDGLTKEQTARLAQIGIDEQTLSNTVIAEGQKRVQNKVDENLKLKDEADKAYQDKVKAAGDDYTLQQKILDDKIEQDRIFYEKQLSQKGLSAAQIKAIEDKQKADKKANAEAQIAIETGKADAEIKLLQAVGAAANALADIAGKNTVTGKILAVSASLINTYAAIAGSLAQYSKPGAPPIPGWAIAQAVATGVVGFKAVADIIKTPVPNSGGSAGSVPNTTEQPRKLARGGVVTGPGSSTSDSIPAMLSAGESVINAQSTAMFAPLLSSINQMGGGARFADGGIAPYSSIDKSEPFASFQSEQPMIKAYVVAQDMTSQQMLDRNTKTRSTL
jgi:hypothetical protein